MGQLPPHANGIRRVSKSSRAIFGDRVHTQLPMEVAEDELVVEVADTSLRYDMTGKRDLYAQSIASPTCFADMAALYE